MQWLHSVTSEMQISQLSSSKIFQLSSSKFSFPTTAPGSGSNAHIQHKKWLLWFSWSIFVIILSSGMSGEPPPLCKVWLHSYKDNNSVDTRLSGSYICQLQLRSLFMLSHSQKGLVCHQSQINNDYFTCDNLKSYFKDMLPWMDLDSSSITKKFYCVVLFCICCNSNPTEDRPKIT